MAAANYEWQTAELTEEEAKLVREYAKSTRPLDALAYTEEFDELARAAGFGESLEEKHRAFTTLLNLRKRGRLPRLLSTE
ncbi:MAG: hypothetical protein AAF711_17575 [Planctomycetota bacterium]